MQQTAPPPRRVPSQDDEDLRATLFVSETRLTITALDGIPRVQPGDDLAGLLIAALEGSGIAPRARDILVVTSKIVSKAEGRYLDLGDARAERAGAGAGADHAQGRAAGRGDPVRGDGGDPRQAQRADRRHAARPGHGQCRHRPVEPRRRGPRPARAAAAGGARRQRAAPQGAARCAFRRRHRRHRLRQRRAGRGGSAPWGWPSARPACRRCGTGAARRTCRGGRWR